MLGKASLSHSFKVSASLHGTLHPLRNPHSILNRQHYCMRQITFVESTALASSSGTPEAVSVVLLYTYLVIAEGAQYNELDN